MTSNFSAKRNSQSYKPQLSPKEIKAELGKGQKALKEIVSRVSDELYRQKQERSKEQER